MLTAASISASFLGAKEVTRNGLTTVVAFALLAFVASLVAAIYVLLPKAGLIFAVNAPVIDEALYGLRDDDAEAHRELAYWLQEWRNENARKLRRVVQFFWVASGSLLLEIVLFAIALQQ